MSTNDSNNFECNFFHTEGSLYFYEDNHFIEIELLNSPEFDIDLTFTFLVTAQFPD